MEALAILAASRAYSKASYCSQPEKKKAASRAYSKASYCSQPEKKKAASHAYSKAIHIVVGQKKRKLPHVLTQRLFIALGQTKRRQPHVPTQRHAIASIEPEKKSLLHVHVNYSSKKVSIVCSFRRDKYALSEPKSAARGHLHQGLEKQPAKQS